MKIIDIFIIISGIGQIFTALVYPYIRHRVFDWYNDVKTETLKPRNCKNLRTVYSRTEFWIWKYCLNMHN